MRPAEFTSAATGKRMCFPPNTIYIVEQPGGAGCIFRVNGPDEEEYWDTEETYAEARRELYEAMTWDISRMLNSEWPEE